MLQTALGYARRGWRIFPCRERTESFTGRSGKPVILKAKSPYVGKDRDREGVAIPNSGGFAKATTDEAQIIKWWKKWPEAMIAAATGPGMDAFVLDIDLFDKETGELFTVEERIEAIETLIGVKLPETAMAQTASGGVHLYFALPELPAGMRLGNSDKRLPGLTNVRGDDTGYVIVPPSRNLDLLDADTGGEYRWLRRMSEIGALPAPPELLTQLFVPIEGKAPKPSPASAPAGPSPRAPAPVATGDPAYDAIRKYGVSALDRECQAVREAVSPGRNSRLNEAALKIAQLVVSTPIAALDEPLARSMLEAAARANPGQDDDAQLLATIESGWSAGIKQGRDLEEIATSSRDRAARGHGGASRRASGSLAPRPANDDYGKPSSQGGGAGFNVGRNGVWGSEEERLTRICALLPQTDLGNLERFLKRYGHDFLFVEQWGWLVWDGSRWNRDMAVPRLGRAVQETMRAIQDEADFIEGTGIPEPPLPLYEAEQLRAHEEQQKGKLDRIVKVARNGDVTLLSGTISKWGRTSEGAGHISCIPKMAEARLSARPADFDVDPLLVNMANGTLVFSEPENGRPASVRLIDPRREDKITKIGTAKYDPKAKSPAYDAFLARVQPDEQMRDFLDVWAGYNMLGVASAQKMAIFYGEGANGKGVWINTKRAILGDYAWSTSINTFMDSDRARKGSDATPDLAALAGRRMVYANEAKEGMKFDDGLVKELTSDEPKGGVRELLKPPFELLITFKNTVICNNTPKIGTDHGIRRRMQIVPWGVIIPDSEQDPRLKSRLVEEASGILNRMVKGALAFLTSGLPMPDAIREATEAYLDQNDILGRFLAQCIEKVPGETIGATAMHELFSAWQTWAQLLDRGGKPWSAKYLATQLEKKSYRKRKSSSMIWDDVWPMYAASDFLDRDGKPIEEELPEPRRKVPVSAPHTPSAEDSDDDFPPP